MKLRVSGVFAISVFLMLVYSLLPVAAQAQFSQQAKLVGTDAIGSPQQGGSVSLSGDGNTAIVGGPNDNDEFGAAWVYVQHMFAGTPGKTNCYGKSVSALVGQLIKN